MSVNDLPEWWVESARLTENAWTDEEPEDPQDGVVFEASEGDTDFSDCACGCQMELSEHVEHLEDWERAFAQLQARVGDVDGSTHVLSFSESQTPEFVMERIRDVIWERGLFADITTIDSEDMMQLREFFAETLDSDGWTLDGLTDQIEQLGVDTADAERIARTETHEILADAREVGYVDQGLADDEYYWTGNLDGRVSPVCAYLIGGLGALPADADTSDFANLRRPDGTNPFHGGQPLPMDELKEHVQEVAQAAGHDPRGWTPHINCRKTFSRFVEGMV